jgi:hypothetical protein
MKNKYNLLLVVAIMVFVIGCSCGSLTDLGSSTSEKPSNKTLTDKVTDKVADDVVDGETSGVQECDDLMKFLKEQAESPDDNWVTKGIKSYIIGQIKKSLRESIEKNKDDKVKLAEQCKDLRKSFDDQLNAEKQKNGAK